MFPLADVLFSTEGIVVISTLMAGMAGTVVYVHRLLMENQAARIKAVETERDNWKALGLEAASVTLTAANNARIKEGRPPLKVLADVVPEHNSPVTPEQFRTAELATVRAAVVAATLDLGIDPRILPLQDKTQQVADKAAEVAVKAAEVAGEVKAATSPSAIDEPKEQ